MPAEHKDCPAPKHPPSHMVRMQIFDSGTNKQIGYKEIPSDILEAAAELSAWLERNQETMTLYGVGLVEHP